MPIVRAELRPEGRKAEMRVVGEVMDSFTETTLLLILGLVCVATLVLLPIKEGEDASGIRAGMQARARGSRHHEEQRQVSRQVPGKRLMQAGRTWGNRRNSSEICRKTVEVVGKDR